jgi:hypothetical protein
MKCGIVEFRRNKVKTCGIRDENKGRLPAKTGGNASLAGRKSSEIPENGW